MKIAIASSGTGHVARGMEAWAESLADSLFRRGIEATLFRAAGRPTKSYEISIPCLKRRARLTKIIAKLTCKGGWRIGLGNVGGVESFTYGTRLLWHLRRNYDLAHVQQGSLAMFLRRARRLKLFKAPFILANGQKAPPEFLARFPYVQYLSPFGKEEITEQIGDRPHWCVIPNFVDTNVFSPGAKWPARAALGLPLNHLIILTVGIIDRRSKRIDLFLKEAAHLCSTSPLPLHFLVAGASHNETDKIVTEGRQLLGDHLTVFRDLVREKMPEVYRAADVFVLCSPREALGMALIEAMSCGIPAVCHSFPVMKWVVGNGGECIDVTEPQSLARVLEKYCNDAELRHQKGTAARQRVLEEFSEEVVVPKIVRMYHRILALNFDEERRNNPENHISHGQSVSVPPVPEQPSA